MWRLVKTEGFDRKLGRLDAAIQGMMRERLIQIARGLTENTESQISWLVREKVVETVRYRDRVMRGRRTRIGDYRLFFTIFFDEQLVVFYDVRHRRVAYR